MKITTYNTYKGYPIYNLAELSKEVVLIKYLKMITDDLFQYSLMGADEEKGKSIKTRAETCMPIVLQNTKTGKRMDYIIIAGSEESSEEMIDTLLKSTHHKKDKSKLGL